MAKYTEEELNKCSKKMLISLFLSMQDQLEALNKNMELLIEQVAMSNQRRFGRSSEQQISGQLTLSDYFNEIEAIMENKYIIEPEFEDVIEEKKIRKKTKGKRDEDLKNLDKVVIPLEIPEEKLNELFPNGYKRLPDEVYKRLKFIPETFEVQEYHVGVYADKDDSKIVKAERPKDLLRNSIVTPSLEAAIMNAKYVNAIPINRMAEEFKRNDVNISRQVMANWTIQCSEKYLSILYDELHKELFNSKVLQADETPVLVRKDGRPAGSKSYMWVYRTGKMYNADPIVIYEYQKTRKTDHPREFLKGYAGTVVTDGYQVYHSIADEREDLIIAGCWSHARRKFAEIVKTFGKSNKESDKTKNLIASMALKQIDAMYKIEKGLTKLTPEERQTQRKLSIKPMVEAFFAWINENKGSVPAQSAKGKAFTYCVNQEKYLKVFLENGEVPMDNNAAEQAIRGFCVGKKNWTMIDTTYGAQASAIIYSIAETAKANNLKPYKYFEHLLTEIPKHMDDKSTDFIADLLPWSDKLPNDIKKNIE